MVEDVIITKVCRGFVGGTFLKKKDAFDDSFAGSFDDSFDDIQFK